MQTVTYMYLNRDIWSVLNPIFDFQDASNVTLMMKQLPHMS